MALTLDNEDKVNITLDNEDKSSSLTWDSSSPLTWDDDPGTWDAPKEPFNLESKNSFSLNNEDKI